MATCWYCESFAKDAQATCEFCGVVRLGTKPGWVAALDTLPPPQDEQPRFGRWYVAWEIGLVILGLWYWPWWAALGAVFIGLLVAVPAAMLTVVLLQQVSRLWLAARSQLLRPNRAAGLFALEEQTTARLGEDQEAFDALVDIMNRERRCHDLVPEAGIVEYRKHKVLPVFSKMIRLSASTLLEMEVRRLINQCEHVCDGAEDCDHQELNRRYERLEFMQRELGQIKTRWSGYLTERVSIPEFAATSEPSADSFAPQLPPGVLSLSAEDLARLRGAHDTLRQLRFALHQTQELRLLRTVKPLAGYEANARIEGATMSGMSTLLRKIQNSDRLSVLEREYQRIVAEQRTVQDAPFLINIPGVIQGSLARSGGKDNENRIDGLVILSNSLPRH